jgi:hypothetical protein
LLDKAQAGRAVVSVPDQPLQSFATAMLIAICSIFLIGAASQRPANL